ncbi:MAG: DUF4160 domain-containing protein [Phaeodactylibacter sp.]|nr:DUF4160 domain-containing protein [Phaeodactylibacter sp.]MCB9296488.1 DUF4160 domain-containing protein [Lewinellaceae bacterium]
MFAVAAFVLMPVIAVVAGVRIYMYRNDHNPPHFHAKHSGDEEVFDLKGKSIRGSIGEKKRKKVRKWAKDKEEFLKNKWEDYNP